MDDMTSETFIRSFRRFAARRGHPQMMVSDNGKTFVGAPKQIDCLKWQFNLERAPWWGGLLERLIRSVKRCLRKVVGGARLRKDELLTVVSEIEAVLNSCPLSYVSTEDFEEPITPSHLLCGRRLLTPAPVDSESESDYELSRDSVRRRARHMNAVIGHFWQRWKTEYLLELRNHHITKHQPQYRCVQVGEIVIVQAESEPRGVWKLGKVESLITGADGNVRGAVVRVANKDSHSFLRRPVQALYPLEVMSTERTAVDNNTATDVPATSAAEQTPSAVQETRPRRAAAIAGEARRSEWVLQILQSDSE